MFVTQSAFSMQIDYLVSPIMFLKGIIDLKYVNIKDIITTHATKVQSFRSLNYLHLVFLEKRRCCCFCIWKGNFKLCVWRKMQWQKIQVFLRFLKTHFILNSGKEEFTFYEFYIILNKVVKCIFPAIEIWTLPVKNPLP